MMPHQHQHQHHPVGDAFSKAKERGVCASMPSEGALLPQDPRDSYRDHDDTAAMSQKAGLFQSARGDREPHRPQGHALEEQRMRVVEKEEGSKDSGEKKEDEEEHDEFRPRAAASARTVVRERRQWALRRARRLEGPNEANQLELGGGLPAGGGNNKVWVDTVVRVAGSSRTAAEGSTRRGKKVKVAGSNGDRGGEGGIVALLVSCGRPLPIVV